MIRQTRYEHRLINKTVDRRYLWRAQTPQVFKLGDLANALSNVDLATITDEASAMERLARRSNWYSNPRNIKVPNPKI